MSVPVNVWVVLKNTKLLRVFKKEKRKLQFGQVFLVGTRKTNDIGSERCVERKYMEIVECGANKGEC